MSDSKDIYTMSVRELSQFKNLNFGIGDIDSTGRPLRMPSMPKDHVAYARVDYGDTAGAEFVVVKSIDDMQKVHDSYSKMRSPMTLDWYVAKNK